MSKIQKIVFVVFFIFLGFLVYLEATKPLPVSWYPSYTKEDKIPLGTFVLHKTLQNNFSNNLIDVNEPPFQFLKANPEIQGTYVFINNSINFDEAETKELLKWTAKGNTLFLASKNYSKLILDTLNLEIKNFYLFNQFETQPLLKLANKSLKPHKTIHIERNLTIPYFSKIDTSSHAVLGFSHAYEEPIKKENLKSNFLKISFGEGQLYLYNQPEIFTNFFLLEGDNYVFTENVLSYINSNTSIYWDNHYKNGKKVNASPLKIIFTNKSLKWAYYLILLGIFLYVLFEGKRKQRAIPVKDPLKNKTLEYTETIAGIYLDKKDNKAISVKVINQFKEYIKNQLRIDLNESDSRFFEDLSSKTNTPKEEIKRIFNDMKQFQNKTIITDQELFTLHKKITQIKNNRDGKP